MTAYAYTKCAYTNTHTVRIYIRTHTAYVYIYIRTHTLPEIETVNIKLSKRTTRIDYQFMVH